MKRNELFPGQRVESHLYGREYFVVSTATWVPTWSPEVYTFMGDEYKVKGSIQSRGRYVLVKNVKTGEALLKRPNELNPIGTYKAAEFSNYVTASNNKIAQSERRAVQIGKLQAFWGDAFPIVRDKFRIFDQYAPTSRIETAIEYGKVHYAIQLLSKS